MPNFSKMSPENIKKWRDGMARRKYSSVSRNGQASGNPVEAVKFRIAAIDLEMQRLTAERDGIIAEIKAVLNPISA
jgi:hypothetical protein